MPPVEENAESKGLHRRNDRVLVVCLVFVAAMVGASFAAVPLYRLFCQTTGFGGTPQRGVEAPGRKGEELFTIRFDANVAPGLPWDFKPEQRLVKVHAGEQTLAFFKAVNDSERATYGSATFNVQPDLAGAYFHKIQCFCFNEQMLAAGQAADMPVSFYVDPEILNDPDLAEVRTITLSYTFFAADPGRKPAVAAQAPPGLSSITSTN